MTSVSDLLQFLKQPDSYPYKPEKVEHIQTHIAHVFIATPYVSKVKKPVDLGFLDYSTLEKRKRFCRREVELNRRLSDDVYLGVVSLVRKGETFALATEVNNAQEVVEYAVKMNKLPEEYFLHSYIQNNSLTDNHLDRVAEKLANFYRSQEPEAEILKWGSIEKIRYNTDENFSQTKQFIGRTIDGNTFKAIREFTNWYYERHEDLFQKRIDQKRIVDGHGDLHLDHIHITPEKVQIYDCIEFNERFRYGDLAADLAFLAMDLDFNNCWQEERYFIDQMAGKLEDPDLLQIIDFYKCYRAYVKGKVKSIQSAGEEVSKEDRKKASNLASRYFNLSLRYALLGSEPVALIVMGRVGTGKSTIAEHLSDKLGIVYYSSDRIRKTMADQPLTERTPDSERTSLYSYEMSNKTYGRLLKKTEEQLEKGESVILDATFSNKQGRGQFVQMFKSRQVNYYLIEVQASDEIIKERLQSRENREDVISDARLEDFEKLSERYEPPDEIDPVHLVQVDTDRKTEDTPQQLYQKLIEMNLK
jgi:aminoglycoside phosphotransferase family enzyme/predicted kinase